MRNVQWQFWVYTGWRKKGPDAMLLLVLFEVAFSILKIVFEVAKGILLFRTCLPDLISF